MSQTFTLTGTESELSVNYHPPIELNEKVLYKLGLIGFFSANSLPNIDIGKNRFRCVLIKKIRIGEGVYTVQNIESILKSYLGSNNISLKYNVSSKSCELKSIFDIDFAQKNSLFQQLGFDRKVYRAGPTHIAKPIESDKIAIENNYWYYSFEKEISLDTGIYSIPDIEKQLKRHFGDSNIFLKINNNTQKCELFSIFDIDFQRENTFHSLLGFSQNLYKGNILHTSDLPVQAVKVITVRVECNITSGAYYNNELVHTIHEFSIDVAPGYAISEVPKNVIYYPINTRTINNISLKIVDQDGELLNFRKEPIVVRLELREWD